MKLSSKTITAIKMFIDLGEHYEEGYISLIDIAKRKDVSKKFLEQIVVSYKNNGLIIGSRGNQGGYRLSKSPKEISLRDIIYISESTFIKERYDYSPIDTVMESFDEMTEKYFADIYLSSLIEKQRELYSNTYII